MNFPIVKPEEIWTKCTGEEVLQLMVLEGTLKYLQDFHSMNLPHFTTEKEEEIFLIMAANSNSALRDMYKSIVPIIDPEYKVNFRAKDNGQWGYYPSQMSGQIALLMRKYKLHSIVDLGSGSGLLLLSLKHMGYGVKGIEIEESMVNISRKLGVPTQCKDILKLTTTDIKGQDCIYFWEPLSDRELCEKFVTNLAKVVTKGQYIIYDCAGVILNYLKANPKFKLVENTRDTLRVFLVT